MSLLFGACERLFAAWSNLRYDMIKSVGYKGEGVWGLEGVGGLIAEVVFLVCVSQQRAP